MQRVAVTGATSFIGLELIDLLAADGVDVLAVVRPSTDFSSFAALATRPAAHTHDGNAETLAMAFRDFGADTVFHLAGIYTRDHEPGDLEMLIASNFSFGLEVLEASRLTGLSCMVNAGSYFQYMDGGADNHMRPVNLYAAAKKAFISVQNYYRDAYCLKAATCVLFDTFGPKDKRAKLFSAIRNAIQSGQPLPVPTEDPVMDFVYGSDAAAAFTQTARLLETDPAAADGKAFAISSGERLRISELVALFEKVSGRQIAMKMGGWPNPDRAIVNLWDGPTVPGWAPEITLAEGVRRYLEERP